MIFNKQSVNSFCEQHKQEVLKWYAQTQPQGEYVTTEKAFVDLDGKQYYRFSGSTTELSLERIGKMQDFLKMMAMGLDEKEIANQLDVMEGELAKALAGQKANVSAIGVCINEIRSRSELLLHVNLLYEFIAVQFVREDEPKMQFVQSIQNQKVEAFKKLVAHNKDYNFFLMPELKLVNGLLKCSPGEWPQLLEDSTRALQRTQRKIELLRGVKLSETMPKTGEPVL